MASKIRQFDFVVGVETSTQPSASTPTGDDDTVTKGYADGNYVRGSEPVANITALKAVVAADRKDGDLRYVSAEKALYYFDSSSAATADEISIVDPDAGSGQWLRDTQTLRLGNQSDARFYETIANGTNYSGFKAPASLAGSVDFILPDGDGAADTFLKTDGSANLTWGTPTASNNAVSAKSADYTVLDGDNIGTIAMSTSTTDRVVTLPTAADNSGRRLRIYKVDSASGNVSVDGEGAETVNDATGNVIVCTNQYDWAEVVCDGSEWFIVDMGGMSYSTLVADTTSGLGSDSSNKILVITNTTVVGNDITVGGGSGSGTIFTINRDGLYYIGINLLSASDTAAFGPTLNQSNLTTSIASLPASERLSQTNISGSRGHCGVTVKLSETDIIRFATDGSGSHPTTSNAQCQFFITQTKKL